MLTRETRETGVQGGEYAIDVPTAFELYTTAGAALDGEDATRGTLEPGKLADLVGYRVDPLTCSVDVLCALKPCFTLVGGRVAFSAHEQLPAMRE